MASELRRTWLVLALALLAILAIAAVTLRSYVADVFPVCRGTLEESGHASLRPGDTSAYVPLDVDRGGFRFHLDTFEGEPGRVSWAKIVRIETDASGTTCECGGVVLRDAGVSNAGGALMGQGDGTYVYVDNRWLVEGTVLRTIERPTRHIQRGRLIARRHFPSLITLVAILALGFAAVRARSGILYATRLQAWTEARLEPNGRITTEAGDPLGVVAGNAPVATATVLVSPNARTKRDVYREVPIIARRQVALGSHALWREITRRHLRDARVLAIVGTACSAAAFVARILGG